MIVGKVFWFVSVVFAVLIEIPGPLPLEIMIQPFWGEAWRSLRSCPLDSGILHHFGIHWAKSVILDLCCILET